jgi:hypothetical protein
MFNFTSVEDVDDNARILRQVNEIGASQLYVTVSGRTPDITRYRAFRLVEMLNATSDMPLEEPRALSRLKRNNNSYWKCILAFIQEASYTPSDLLIEAETEDRLD